MKMDIDSVHIDDDCMIFGSVLAVMSGVIDGRDVGSDLPLLADREKKSEDLLFCR